MYNNIVRNLNGYGCHLVVGCQISKACGGKIYNYMYSQITKFIIILLTC